MNLTPAGLLFSYCSQSSSWYYVAWLRCLCVSTLLHCLILKDRKISIHLNM